jgi:signal transduction histidine kinase
VATVEVVLRGYDDGGDLITALVLALCATVPVVLARGHVLGAAAIMITANGLTLAVGQPLPVAAVLAQAVVAFLVGLRYATWLTACFVAPLLIYLAVQASGTGAGTSHRIGTLLPPALLVAAAAAGSLRRARDQATARRAARRVVEDSQLEYAARGERARIARELHDVVAHHISMISVQAETARLTTAGLPPEGAARLLAIGETARTALAEMRRMLGVLREDAVDPPARAPQPGLHQLVELIDEVRESTGVSTRLILHGAVSPLDPGLELTAYRIVQEALTNARRHAPGAPVDVRLDYVDGALLVRVLDSGPGPDDSPTAGRHGLLGMRERAAAVGGTMQAGPTPRAGFLVQAVLPTARANG